MDFSPSLEQAILNHKKVVRAAIRLKHSIEADNELAVVMPIVVARLAGMVHDGLIPALSVAEIMDLAANGSSPGYTEVYAADPGEA